MRRPRLSAVLATTLGVLVLAAPARADVVDDLYERGNAAAAQGEWSLAAGCYEQARALLPDRSAELSYNLGTAYAQLGHTGYAAYHLRRSIQRASDPSAEVVEGARRNLGILDRRIEQDAERTGGQISAPRGWWPRIRSALAARWLAWLTWIFAAGLIASCVVSETWSRKGRSRAIPRAIAWLMAGLFLIGASVHGVALRGERRAAHHVVLPNLALAREGPSAGRSVSVRIVGGSRVRQIQQRGGWTEVRLDSGLTGWLSDDEVADLEAEESVAPVADIPQCPTDR